MHLRGTAPAGLQFHSTYSTSADVGLFIYLKIPLAINHMGDHHRHKGDLFIQRFHHYSNPWIWTEEEGWAGWGYVFKETPKCHFALYLFSHLFHTCLSYLFSFLSNMSWYRSGGALVWVLWVLYQSYLWKYDSHKKDPRPPELKPLREVLC